MAGKKIAAKFTAEDLLKRYSPEVRRWAGELRKLVRAALPKAHERAYPGWRVIFYCRDEEMRMKGMFCGIGPLKAGVNFYFHRGARLPDPHGLLEGAGKGMRHVKIRSAGDLHPAALKKLVRQAYKLSV